MDFSALIKKIEHVAEAVLPTMVPGAAPAVAAGKAVINLIDEAKATFGEKNVAALQAQRVALLARVSAHAEGVAKRLDA